MSAHGLGAQVADHYEALDRSHIAAAMRRFFLPGLPRMCVTVGRSAPSPGAAAAITTITQEPVSAVARAA